MTPTIVRTIARADPSHISRLGTWTRERLKTGELGLDIHGLRDVLAQRGVVWRD
jgi:hypothetical protein